MSLGEMLLQMRFWGLKINENSEMPAVLLGISWPALKGPLRNHFWKKRRPPPYWGGENSGNALEASNALNYRAWGIPAVLSRGIPGNALRAFPGSFRNFSRISSGKSQPYWPRGPKDQKNWKFRARLKISSEPPTAALFFVGNRDVEIEIFDRD